MGSTIMMIINCRICMEYWSTQTHNVKLISIRWHCCCCYDVAKYEAMICLLSLFISFHWHIICKLLPFGLWIRFNRFIIYWHKHTDMPFIWKHIQLNTMSYSTIVFVFLFFAFFFLVQLKLKSIIPIYKV